MMGASRLEEGIRRATLDGMSLTILLLLWTGAVAYLSFRMGQHWPVDGF